MPSQRSTPRTRPSSARLAPAPSWLRSAHLFLLLAGAALGLPLALWAFWLEPASLFNEDHELALSRWPAACDGLRIAVLSDIHTGSPHHGVEQLDEIVALANRAEPDLVLLAGDYVIHGVVGGRFVTPERIAEGLSRLAAPLGVHAVLGNHDWWLDGERVMRALEGVGISVLEDRTQTIEAGACRFTLLGISDFAERPHDHAGALAVIDPTSSVLAFTHNPDVFPELPGRIALTIAGHTHGGQVYLPGIGRPIVPSRFGQRYAIGHVVEGGRHLFVSSGLGTSILPVRFLVPPEVSVLTLRAKGGGRLARSRVSRDGVVGRM